ncbi:MAG TPA: hypothetical protein EYP41_03455 [Anaerolineae bacterium]|nr:hypothetical protein [Anaerolineae bacterium]
MKSVIDRFSLKLLLAIALLIICGDVFAGAENPFGEIVPEQEGGVFGMVATVAKVIIILFGLGIIGGGLAYGGAHILSRVREANTSKEGAGTVLGAIGLALVVIFAAAVIGGALLIGAEPAAELINNATGGN